MSFATDGENFSKFLKMPLATDSPKALSIVTAWSYYIPSMRARPNPAFKRTQPGAASPSPAVPLNSVR